MALMRDLRLAVRALFSYARFACALFGRVSFLTLFRIAPVVPGRRPGSGARGLIKAPAGGVGVRPHKRGCDLYYCIDGDLCNPPLVKARGVWGVL